MIWPLPVMLLLFWALTGLHGVAWLICSVLILGVIGWLGLQHFDHVRHQRRHPHGR